MWIIVEFYAIFNMFVKVKLSLSKNCDISL